MPFVFVYISCGEAFYVYQNDEGYYCANVYGEWMIGESINEVTTAVDYRCYELMQMVKDHGG